MPEKSVFSAAGSLIMLSVLLEFEKATLDLSPFSMAAPHCDACIRRSVYSPFLVCGRHALQRRGDVPEEITGKRN